MQLRFVNVDDQGPDIQKTQYLFETAFPEEERPPFSMMMEWDHRDFYGIYREDGFVGLVSMVRLQDLLYVFFLAIDEGHRNEGIGSAVLAKILSENEGKRVFLLAEETDGHYPDMALRLRRQGFYHRNGFQNNGVKILEFGVMYDMLVHGGDVSRAEFVDVMRSLIGEENARRFYNKI